MSDLIEPHEPLQDCDCKACAVHERNRLRTVIATARNGRNEAIHAAVAAPYFDDSSKFCMYRAANGFSARREDGITPNGNPVGQRWVLRDANGAWVDVHQYRHDLFEHNGFRTDY